LLGFCFYENIYKHASNHTIIIIFSIPTLSETIEKFDNRKKSNQLDEWVKKGKNSSTANFQSATVLSAMLVCMAIHNRATIIDN
jgi:hypothetical protein